jgi:tetratricopeptide (TPR) repeat protein
MKTTGKLIIFIFTFLALVANTYAQSPREELQQMVEQLQKIPYDNALREKIIRLAIELKPAPAIPEEAREPFVMGATVLKKASDPAGASKAVDLFTQALNIAPWFADAYYNRAIARQAAGQFEPAIDDLKLYLGFKLTDSERREAQDKIYSLKAEAQLGVAKKAEEQKAAATRQRQQAEEAQKGYVSQGGLTWMPVTFTKPWAEANSYCANTTIGGQTGWRLPTRDELFALYASGAMKGMKGQRWTFGGTWSSTRSSNSAHYAVTLDSGNDDSGLDTGDGYVTCVR